MNIARLNPFASRPRRCRRAWRIAPALMVWAAVLGLAGQVGQPLAQFAHEAIAHAGPAAIVDHDAPADHPADRDADHGSHPNCLICQHLASFAAVAIAPDGTVVEVLPTLRWSRPDAPIAPARPDELTPVLRRGPPSFAC